MSNRSKSCQGKDVFSRMNFLYQASVLMAGKSDNLSAYYGNLCKSIGKRSVLRMEPRIKITLCKRCNIALKPNKTADIEFHDEKSMKLVCKKCYSTRNFLINPNYNLWLENPDSIAEVFKFDCISNVTQSNGNNAKKTNSINCEGNKNSEKVQK